MAALGSFVPCLVRAVGQVPSLGDPLLDEYLRFTAARVRPNTLSAQAFDLKVFFTFVPKPPQQVTVTDVLSFIEAQRAPRRGCNVVRLADGEVGLAASTIKRRLATVSSLFDYLFLRGVCDRNPVPRSLGARHARGSGAGQGARRGAPLVRAPRKLPRVLAPGEVTALTAALRTDRDRAMVALMVHGGLRRCEVLGLRFDLRQFAASLVDAEPPVTRVADISREHVEAHKEQLADRPAYRGKTLSKTTLGMRMGHLRTFFARIIEWGYDDAPARIPVYGSDRPRLDKPLPKFLDDARAAAFMTAARGLPAPLDRLIVTVLARTGMRRGELLGLTVDAIVQIGTGYWLRTPVGKLHTDRYIPLHPQLKDLLDVWIAARPDWQASSLLLTERGRPIPPTRVEKAVQKAATAAGIGHVHPHQLRHTLATQAINRGMSLEAIAALLGHHDLSMTMVYARIADRTVADEYFAVTKPRSTDGLMGWR